MSVQQKKIADTVYITIVTTVCPLSGQYTLWETRFRAKQLVESRLPFFRSICCSDSVLVLTLLVFPY